MMKIDQSRFWAKKGQNFPKPVFWVVLKILCIDVFLESSGKVLISIKLGPKPAKNGQYFFVICSLLQVKHFKYVLIVILYNLFLGPNWFLINQHTIMVG